MCSILKLRKKFICKNCNTYEILESEAKSRTYNSKLIVIKLICKAAHWILTSIKFYNKYVRNTIIALWQKHELAERKWGVIRTVNSRLGGIRRWEEVEWEI
jgi:RNase P subunit RPR2